MIVENTAARMDTETTRSLHTYKLESQVGFLLRLAVQHHASIFQSFMIEGLTPTQYSAVVKLYEMESISQNLLGRMTAMDAATIKGVIGRLKERGFVETEPDTEDKRRLRLRLTERGSDVARRAIPCGELITRKALETMSEAEEKELIRLLRKMA